MLSEKNGGNGPRISVSTWSLHRMLGDPTKYGPDSEGHIFSLPDGNKGLALLELPERLAAFGISTLEICHFHLPSLDQGYLQELRATLETAHIELFSVLIDDGDVTHPTHGARDLAWISSWIDVAGLLGAKRTRVIAGKAAPTEATLRTSVQALAQLAQKAEASGVRLMTENWFGLFSQPAAIKSVLDSLDGRVGLCFDFGNWGGPSKYEDLSSIAGYAESCHAKASFSQSSVMDVDDYTRCLDITRAAGFAGPYTLIYDGPDADEWAGLAKEREVVNQYIGSWM
jgi:sugar phosphate isomerase/epimerase